MCFLEDEIEDEVHCSNGSKQFLQMLSFAASICTIIGVLIALPQLQLANEQLKKLNAEAAVKIDFHFTKKGEISIKNYEPFDIFITARNYGDGPASYWRSMLIFCDNIKIKKKDPDWKEEGGAQFVFESQKPLISDRDQPLQLYSEELDSIANFTIETSMENYWKKKPVPIALIATGGEKMSPSLHLITLTGTGFFKKELKEEMKINHAHARLEMLECRKNLKVDQREL